MAQAFPVEFSLVRRAWASFFILLSLLFSVLQSHATHIYDPIRSPNSAPYCTISLAVKRRHNRMSILEVPDSLPSVQRPSLFLAILFAPFKHELTPICRLGSPNFRFEICLDYRHIVRRSHNVSNFLQLVRDLAGCYVWPKTAISTAIKPLPRLAFPTRMPAKALPSYRGKHIEVPSPSSASHGKIASGRSLRIVRPSRW